MKRVLGLLLMLLSCRDEQAGPQRRSAGKPPSEQPKAQNGNGTGQVRTVEAIPSNIRLAFQSEATWAQGAVAYLGSAMEPAAPQAGQTVQLLHFFRANKPPPAGWKFFVHVVDSAGQMVANADHELQQGNAPLERWPVGRIVFDQHTIQMPEAQGPLRVLFGFWNDQGRLAVDQAAAQDGQQRMLGPKLESAAAIPLPEYHAPKVKKPIVIDGKLDDAAWATAPEVRLTTSFDGRPTTRRTTAKVTWDDAFIYVAFDCEDPDVWGSLRNQDDAIYNEDAVEVFLNASGDLANYNELQVSPHNVNFDARFVSRRSDLDTAMKWSSGMVTQVNVRGTLDDDSDKDEGWSAEMKIPVAHLAGVPHPPRAGDVWRFNLYRLEHIKRRQQIEGQSFSPLFVGDFHALPRFGKLIFD